jgi:hypothetical protein
MKVPKRICLTAIRPDIYGTYVLLDRLVTGEWDPQRVLTRIRYKWGMSDGPPSEIVNDWELYIYLPDQLTFDPLPIAETPMGADATIYYINLHNRTSFPIWRESIKLILNSKDCVNIPLIVLADLNLGISLEDFPDPDFGIQFGLDILQDQPWIPTETSSVHFTLEEVRSRLDLTAEYSRDKVHVMFINLKTGEGITKLLMTIKELLI